MSYDDLRFLQHRGDRQHAERRREAERHEPRHHGRQHVGRKGRGDHADICRHQPRAGVDADHLHEKAEGISDKGSCEHEQRNGEHGNAGQRERSSKLERLTPAVNARCWPAAPDAAVFPGLRRCVDRREQASDDPDATAAHDVDLHAGFVQRSQDARVIGTASTVAAQKNGGSQVWRIAHASSWMVTSLMISKLRVPLGVVTSISSPSVFPTMARPIGELVEMSPLPASASSGMTS